MLQTELIQKALDLTGKSMDDTYEYINKYTLMKYWDFSYPKFFYYLLSTWFIWKYTEDKDMNWAECSQIFWQAIYEYQAGLEQPLIELLKKI